MEVQYVGDRLRELAAETGVPGAQLAVYTEGETLSLATGVQRIGAGDAVDTGTAFPYGSVSKAFTATVVMQLVSDGDVELDDTVAAFLPEFTSPADADMAAVTVRQLLSHTGGLLADHELDDVDERSLRRYAAAVAAAGLLHRPGEVFSYSNTGYNLLGRVIEAVTDMSWQSAVESFLLRPLGIDPYFLHGPAASRAVATGHAVRLERGGARPVDVFLPPTWAPASGLGGSAEDLVALARLHFGDAPSAADLLDEDVRAEMHTPVPAADAFGMADGWALGLARYGGADGGWLGHDGTVDGGTAHLRFHPGRRVAVALTANATTGTLLWPRIVEELRKAGIDVADHQHPVPDARSGQQADLERLLGDYLNGDTRFTVARHEGGLRLTDRTGLVAAMTLHGPDGLLFTARRTDADEAPYTGRFVLDGGTGEAALMQLAGRSARRERSAAR
ncbi:serine hydrolase domain-containing protein [Streptomyces halobius]|uniref:Beta-lactamase family protein n=1 Tax=Streptomyces halobius TaxID=2879846 RepID=A0ABY4MCC0_9ACTN|nr:serine hydrolase domain-containing protein [Streptomyces halobius]UQA94006.1 beta-lactamase family protein [Streptomyces halobius]